MISLYTKKCRLLPLQFILPVFILLAFILLSCKSNREYGSPPTYNLNHPYVIKLPSELDEISGITYYGKDNSLFAESDDKGGLYKIFLNKPTDIRKWKFSHKRNYEDIVLHDSIFYVLNNNGDIVTLTFLKDSLIDQNYKFPDQGKNEFESLYYDDTLQKLVLICKDCEADKKAAVSAFSFDTKQHTFDNLYTIDADKVVEKTSPNSNRYKPSGAAVNPVTGELYILSSINKLLVVAERNGKIKEMYHLDPSLFNQPEGIAFMPNGNLFISNEAGNLHPATILFYQFKNAENK